MKICQTHWDQLRQALDERGLSHLVAKSSEDAHAALVEQLQGDAKPSGYDPLMTANFAIFSAFLEDAGIAGLSVDCPLCVVAEAQPGLDQEWIKGCSDDQLKHARALGLVPAQQ